MTIIIANNALANAEYTLQAAITETVTAVLTESLLQTLPVATYENIEIAVGDVNNTLTGRHCDSPLSVGLQGNRNLGRVTVQVSCDVPRWSFFVPTDTRVHLPVVVTSVPVTRGTKLQSEHVQLQVLDIAQLRQGYFLSIEEVLGHEVRRTLQPGIVVNAYNANAPALVERGEWITIQSGGTGVVVTAVGQALDSGGLGEQIRVKNMNSGQTVRAWVIDKGVVVTRRTN